MIDLQFDINAIGALAVHVLDDINSSLEQRENPPALDVDLQELGRALARFLELASRIEAQAATGDLTVTEAEISEIGDYGLQLLDQLSAIAAGLELLEHGPSLVSLYPSLALWIAGHGGHLENLPGIANAFAELANHNHDPDELAVLCEQIGEIIEAAGPLLRQDLERTNPGRPWRLLNLNHGIVATRSHDTRLMAATFDKIGEYLPEEMPGFLAQGMQQMEKLDYPQPVREVMERYYTMWSNSTLH